MRVGTVGTITCFPVKSMGGQRVDRAEVTARGLRGDREWAVYTADGGIGSGKATRRFRRVDGLLGHLAALDGGVPVVTTPAGAVLVAGTPEADTALSATLGQPVRLAREGDVAHHDESPLHLVSTASLRALGELLGEPVDPRRFRANLVVDVPGTGFAEDAWVGHELAVGPDLVLRVLAGMPRCVMVNAAQPGLAHDPRVLRSLSSREELALGVTAEVVRPGTVREGDEVLLGGGAA